MDSLEWRCLGMDWRRLRIMPFGKRGARCCCGVIECTLCSGATPSQLSVVLAGTTNCGTCSNCSGVNGTYVLDKVDGFDCRWSSCFDIDPDITATAATNTSSLSIAVVITDLFGTIYVDGLVSFFSGNACDGFTLGTSSYQSSVAGPTIDCGFSSYGVLYQGTTHYCNHSGSTMSITAV